MNFEGVVSRFVIFLLWLWLFFSVSIITGGAGYWASGSLSFSVFAGGGVGIIVSESIRTKYGLIQFFGRLISHRDIDGAHKKYREK